MSRELFLFQFKKLIRGSVAWGMFMALLSLGAILSFTENNITALSEARAQAPEFFSALKVGGSATLLDHLASLLYGFLLPVAGSALSVRLAERLLPAMIQTGEMSFYLSLPIRRGAFALTQGAVLLSCLILSQLTVVLGTIIAAAILKPGELNLLWFLILNLGQLCLWALSAGIALMFACMSDDRRGARSRAALLIGLFYAVAMLGGIYGLPRLISWFSPYSLLDVQSLSKGRFALETLGMPAIGMLCFLIGIRQFNGRDLPL